MHRSQKNLGPKTNFRTENWVLKFRTGKTGVLKIRTECGSQISGPKKEKWVLKFRKILVVQGHRHLLIALCHRHPVELVELVDPNHHIWPQTPGGTSGTCSTIIDMSFYFEYPWKQWKALTPIDFLVEKSKIQQFDIKLTLEVRNRSFIKNI